MDEDKYLNCRTKIVWRNKMFTIKFRAQRETVHRKNICTA